MCLGSRTTQSPAASNTNYFGTNPWGQDPMANAGVQNAPIDLPNVSTTAQGGSTGSSNLKIGSGTKSAPKSSGNKSSGSGSVRTGGVNY